MNNYTVETAFKFLLLCTMLLSFYIFIMSICSKTHKYKTYAWQFPMLLALFVELLL